MKTLIEKYYLIKALINNEFLQLPYKIPSRLIRYNIPDKEKDKEILENWNTWYRWITYHDFKKVCDKNNRTELFWRNENPFEAYSLPIIIRRLSFFEFMRTGKLFSIDWDWNHRIWCAEENHIKKVWAIFNNTKKIFHSRRELNYLISQYLKMHWEYGSKFLSRIDIYTISRFNDKAWIESFIDTKEKANIDGTCIFFITWKIKKFIFIKQGYADFI